MADLPSSFWGGWITVITVTSLAGLVWLLFSIYFGSGNANEQEHVVWDETLNEGTHPAPLWWFWLFFSALIFSAIYLILYPGLGSYSGALKWSQGHRLEESYAAYNENYDSIRQSILATPLATLQADEFMMTSARGIFNRNCSICHGLDGGGQALIFPNIMDDEWQWGRSVTQIEQSIRTGRRAVMPAWGNLLSGQQIDQVIQYIRALGQDTVVQENEPGKAEFDQYCTACHGINGTGNTAVGAPDLTDDAWLYGDNRLADIITHGRNGIMPGFEGHLDDTQIHMLIALLTR